MSFGAYSSKCATISFLFGCSNVPWILLFSFCFLLVFWLKRAQESEFQKSFPWLQKWMKGIEASERNMRFFLSSSHFSHLYVRNSFALTVRGKSQTKYDRVHLDRKKNKCRRTRHGVSGLREKSEILNSVSAVRQKALNLQRDLFQR